MKTNRDREAKSAFKCGFVAVAGRPNAGKSTLVNRLVGEEVAIVTPKPQTTRNRITGIRNDPDTQVIFLDTPGVIDGARGMNAYLMKTARAAIADADIVVYLLDAAAAARRPAEADTVDLAAAEAIAAGGRPALLVLNKADLLSDKGPLLPLTDAWSRRGFFKEVFPVSAADGAGVDDLYAAIRSLLPAAERLFPADQWSDLPEKFFVSEIIRGELFGHLREELPYSSAVVVESFDETGREEGVVRIHATIHVEKNSQRGIVIGKGGAMLKAIGISARQAAERFLGARVHLMLRAAVSRNWTRDEREMRKLGCFDRQE
ncbi:MAG: GTPase Era [Deltaproteobacteria bacterium]|nr:GTPase Era [Deltaproteobacteria bacterium]